MISQIPLWTILQSREEYGQSDLPLLTVKSESGIDLRDITQGRQPSEDMSNYRVVRTGDLVVNRLWARFGAYGTAPMTGVISPAYWVLQINQEMIHPRFLHYLLRSEPYRQEIARRSKNMPPNGFELLWEQFRWIRIPQFPIDEQRRIADFLDAETGHMERVATLQVAAQKLLEEREYSLLNSAVDEHVERFGNLPLRRFLVGIEQGVSPQCDAIAADEREWGVLKVSSVRPGNFMPSENKKLPNDLKPERRYEVHEGDLLVTRANTPSLVGATAVVGQTRDRLLLCDKIFRVRLAPGILPEYVAVVARGERIRSLCSSAAHGTSQSMVNLKHEEVKGWPIPWAPLSTQKKLMKRVSETSAQMVCLHSSIERQLKLLTERRQALITAAVTGQIDVTTASRRGMQ